MVTDEEKQVIQAYVDAYNQFDLPTMLGCLSNDIVFKKISAGVVDTESFGIEAFKTLAEETDGLYSHRDLKVLGWNKKDGKVVARISCRVILNVDLPSGLKTGSRIDIRGVSEFMIEDAKIAAITDKSS